MTKPGVIALQVAYATLARQVVIDLEAPDGASIADVIALSGIGTQFPEIDMAAAQVGVWGKVRRRDFKLRAGDRVEILRVLTADPKEARRNRSSTRKKS